MRQLPVRARVLVGSVAGAALVILAWALVQVGHGAAVPKPVTPADGRLTLVELFVVAMVIVVTRSLTLSALTPVARRRNLSLAFVLLAAAMGLIWSWEWKSQHDSALVVLVVLALVTLVAGYSSFTFGEGRFTVDQVLPVLIASYLIVGTAGAVVVAGFMSLIPTPGSERVKTIFNSSVKVVCVWVAGCIFYLPARGDTAVQRAWHSPTSLANSQWLLLVLTFLAANVVFVAANAVLVGAIVSFSNEVPWFRTTIDIARNVGAPLILNSALGLILAIVYVHSGVGPLAMVLVLLPLFAARWVFAQIAGERSAQEATLAALIKAVETKDWYTKGHSERVAVAALQIGASLQFDADLMRELRFAGMLHDIGKLGVPTGVLIKPGRLDEAEFDAIKRHPVLGQEVVRGIEFLDEAKRGIYYHHERIDGRGYPEGLKGDEIPLFARILGVADAFDSMTQVRSYRGARSVEAALEELDAHRGTQFDTDMVDALVAALDAGWQPETPPVVEQPDDARGVPALGVDDDDPSAAAALASHRPRKVDAP